MSYYKNQLNKLKDSEYPKSLRMFDGQGEVTNQIDLNLESIEALREFLNKEENRLKTLDKGE